MPHHSGHRGRGAAAGGRSGGERTRRARGKAATVPRAIEQSCRRRGPGLGGDVAVAGWVLDKSAAARAGDETVGAQLAELAGQLYICPVGELEQLYSARSARHYDLLQA